jgi:hypothetical protein
MAAWRGGRDRVPGDFLPVTQEGLAQLLGVRRTTVTLTMSKLGALGAIPSDRRGFVEIDRPGSKGWHAAATR